LGARDGAEWTKRARLLDNRSLAQARMRMLLCHSLRMHFIDLECARPIDFAMWAEIRSRR
jgi:hypothetical protein